MNHYNNSGEKTNPHLDEAPTWGCRWDWGGGDIRALSKNHDCKGVRSSSSDRVMAVGLFQHLLATW